MLSSPVWRGTPRAAFGLGLVAGGVLSAALLGVFGSLVRAPLALPVRWALTALAVSAVLLRDCGVLRFPLPENRRLVPDSVLRLGRHLGPLQFGVEMGTGVRTYLPSGLPYAAAAAIVLVAPFPAALCAGAGFGLGRALMTTANLHYGEDRGWDDEWLRHRRWLVTLTVCAFTAPLLAAGWIALS